MTTNGAATTEMTVTNVESTNIVPSFQTKEGFELAQRAARLLSQSSLVPKEYQGNLANCVIALNMANRMMADPLMVMQNLYIVHGRPGWSSQFLISTFNASGRFSALRYEWVGEEGKDSWGCRAWAVERETGEKLVGSTVTIGIAKKEGWYSKNGSKWQTMPQQMLMYRAASWFIRAYAPEIAMGMHTAEELRDTIDLEPSQYTVKDESGEPLVRDLNARMNTVEEDVVEAEVVSEPEPEQMRLDPEQQSFLDEMDNA